MTVVQCICRYRTTTTINTISVHVLDEANRSCQAGNILLTRKLFMVLHFVLYGYKSWLLCKCPINHSFLTLKSSWLPHSKLQYPWRALSSFSSHWSRSWLSPGKLWKVRASCMALLFKRLLSYISHIYASMHLLWHIGVAGCAFTLFYDLFGRCKQGCQYPGRYRSQGKSQ